MLSIFQHDCFQEVKLMKIYKLETGRIISSLFSKPFHIDLDRICAMGPLQYDFFVHKSTLKKHRYAFFELYMVEQRITVNFESYEYSPDPEGKSDYNSQYDPAITERYNRLVSAWYKK